MLGRRAGNENVDVFVPPYEFHRTRIPPVGQSMSQLRPAFRGFVFRHVHLRSSTSVLLVLSQRKGGASLVA